MARAATGLNASTDAPKDAYRVPNEDPQFDTNNKEVELGQKGTPVNSTGTIGVATGGTGKPVSNRG